ncbi:MAG: hypothetical protein HYW78_02785 [Parcubacteria group bacterium]|nr:hypothetical protein [Parcubacteria group bacterium]
MKKFFWFFFALSVVTLYGIQTDADAQSVERKDIYFYTVVVGEHPRSIIHKEYGYVQQKVVEDFLKENSIKDPTKLMPGANVVLHRSLKDADDLVQRAVAAKDTEIKRLEKQREDILKNSADLEKKIWENFLSDERYREIMDAKDFKIVAMGILIFLLGCGIFTAVYFIDKKNKAFDEQKVETRRLETVIADKEKIHEGVLDDFRQKVNEYSTLQEKTNAYERRLFELSENNRQIVLAIKYYKELEEGWQRAKLFFEKQIAELTTQNTVSSAGIEKLFDTKLRIQKYVDVLIKELEQYVNEKKEVAPFEFIDGGADGLYPSLVNEGTFIKDADGKAKRKFFMCALCNKKIPPGSYTFRVHWDTEHQKRERIELVEKIEKLIVEQKEKTEIKIEDGAESGLPSFYMR